MCFSPDESLIMVSSKLLEATIEKVSYNLRPAVSLRPMKIFLQLASLYLTKQGNDGCELGTKYLAPALQSWSTTVAETYYFQGSEWTNSTNAQFGVEEMEVNYKMSTKQVSETRSRAVDLVNNLAMC